MKDAINVKTNAGAFKVDTKATATHIRHEVWFNGNAITNIVSFAKMADIYRVKYNHEQQTFMAMIPRAPMIFCQMHNLYVHFPEDNTQELDSRRVGTKSNVKASCMLETIRDNMKGFTKH